MTSFSLNFFSNQIQCSYVFLIIQFPESPTSNNRTLLQTKREVSRAYQSSQKIFRVRRPFFDLTWFIRRRQSSGFYRRLQGPVSDHVLINRASKERALHHVIKYSQGTIVDQLTETEVVAIIKVVRDLKMLVVGRLRHTFSTRHNNLTYNCLITKR